MRLSLLLLPVLEVLPNKLIKPDPLLGVKSRSSSSAPNENIKVVFTFQLVCKLLHPEMEDYIMTNVALSVFSVLHILKLQPTKCFQFPTLKIFCLNNLKHKFIMQV